MYAESVAFVGALTYRFSELIPLFNEHLDDQDGEVLPHLFMADVERWAEDGLGSPGQRKVLKRLLDFLDKEYADAGDEVQELIVVSFLEHFPRPNSRGSELRSMIGERLRKELDLIG